MRKTVLPLLGLLLTLILTGCGGSSNSSSSTGLQTNDPLVISPIPATIALISQTRTAANGTTFFSVITVDQSGAASYTQAVDTTPSEIQNGTGTFETGRGTLPAAQAAKLFQDLSSAKPLTALPVYGEPMTTTSLVPPNSFTVQYQGQVGHIDDPNDAREAALAADAAAIAQALGIPQS